MIIPDLHMPTISVPASLSEVYEAYRRYRNALEMLAALEHQGRQHQMLRELEELRVQYQAAVDALSWNDELDNYVETYWRDRLHQEKTLSGLAQVILRHAVWKLFPSQSPYSLLHRVRQITASHPAFAPPQFA